jgi:hypothetical protein
MQVAHTVKQDRRTAFVLTDGALCVVELYSGDNCLPYCTRRFAGLSEAVTFANTFGA